MLGLQVLGYITGRRLRIVLLLVVSNAALIGRCVYPYVSRAYGGGAARLARIDVKPGSVASDLQAAFAHPSRADGGGVFAHGRRKQRVEGLSPTDIARSRRRGVRA